MSKTIVQAYGPIYGEPVNGTVQGRPNGSVYVPESNTIQIALDSGFEYVKYANTTTFNLCDSSSNVSWSKGLHVDAKSQDLASNIQVQIFSDSACTTRVGYRNYGAGGFNLLVTGIVAEDDTLTDGTTVYIRAQLMNLGTPVSTSDALPITVVIP